MSSVAFDKRLANADRGIPVDQTDETGRWSRGRAWVVLLAVSLGLWALIGVVVMNVLA